MDSVAGSNLTISLITIGPGEEVWERFGHNAIQVEDHSLGTRVAYNYGLFSFRQENFVLRFIQGRMLYWMAGLDAREDLDRYVAAHRSIWAQELDLPPASRLELKKFLEWNALDENKFYRYDYYRDNCSTRVRDALDRVTGGALRRQTQNTILPVTYRWHTRRLTASSLPVYTGLELLLGPRSDRPLSAWEEMFLPQKLQEHIRRVSLTGADGRKTSLVKAERTLYLSDRYPVPDAPPNLVGYYFAAGAIVGAAFYLLGRAGASRRWARGTFLVAVGLWASVSTVAGLVLATMWAFTDHVIVRGNQNSLQFCILSAVLLVVLRSWFVNRSPGGNAAPRMAFVLMLLSLFGLLLHLIPGAAQVNGEIIALVLPVLAGILLGLRIPSESTARA
ncbi:MAG: DUF4105 domain-containing protein [Gemmatimonadota bacterium]